MEKKHIAGFFVTLMFMVSLLCSSLGLNTQPANILNNTFKKIGANRKEISRFYSSKFIHIVKNEFVNSIKRDSLIDPVLYSAVNTLSNDELCFYSLFLIVSQSTHWPTVYSENHKELIAEYNILAPINFDIKLFCFRQENNLLFFDSISGLNKLLSEHPYLLKQALEKEMEDY